MKRFLPRLAGSCVQGLVTGALLALAVLRLLHTASGTHLFRYQGF